MQSAPVTDITPEKPKVPLREAVAILSALCHRIEDGASPDEAIQAEFAETRLDLAQAIDRRKAVLASIGGMAETAKQMAKGYQEQAKRLEGLAESLKKRTLEIMLEAPDLPYRDSAGRKVSIVNGIGSLKLSLNLGQKTVSSIIDAVEMHEHKIPLEFVKPVSFYALDTAAVRSALIDGRELPWARIEPSVFLRGL